MEAKKSDFLGFELFEVSESLPRDKVAIVSPPPEGKFFKSIEELADWLIENNHVAVIKNLR